jgi:hypothetical protein
MFEFPSPWRRSSFFIPFLRYLRNFGRRLRCRISWDNAFRKAPLARCVAILVALFSILAGVIVSEIALRFTDSKYVMNPSVEFPAGYFQEDPELGTDLAPNRPPARFSFRGPEFFTFTNRFSCFDYDYPIKDGYVLALGDSNTWGFVALQDNWTTHLEQLTGEQIVKCGVSGTGTKYQMAKARKTIEKIGKAPRAIIVLYEGNDLNDDVVSPERTLIEEQPISNFKSLDLRTGKLIRYSRPELEVRYKEFRMNQRSWFNLLRHHSVIVSLSAYAFDVVGRRMSRTGVVGPFLKSKYEFWLWQVDARKYPWVEEAFISHANNILAFRDMAKDYGAKFILFSNKPWQGEMGQRLRDMLADELEYYHDLTENANDADEGRNVQYRFDSHLNALGHRLAAEAMYQYLRKAKIF